MLKIIILVFSSVLLNLSVTDGQVVQNGQCSEVNVNAVDYSVDDLVGSWYEVLRTPNAYQGGDCSTLEFTRNSNESDTTITLNNVAYNSNFREESIGLLTQNGTGRLLLNSTIFPQPLEIVVLLFVPNLIAMGYSCVDINANERGVYIWTLGKITVHPELQEGFINSTLNPMGITISQLEQIDHSEQGCYALPDLTPGESIILPGSCNLNISVEQNFDIERFTGEWHQIYSYYSDNIVGTCGRAKYSLSGNVVNVLNSEVVNQTLRSISGVATSLSDGEGKLSVTLEVLPGINATQELWVLATDYDNYAVLYSCENLPNDQKRVYSWINGRTSNLSATSQAAVNATVDSLIELNYRYFLETQRSDDDCFYYPEAVPNQVVIFRGQCDMNVSVVENFNASRYLGVWYNIESYPSTFQTGSCNTALYTLNAVEGVVEVYNTQVINETLDFAHGVGVPDPSGVAKLVVSFPIAGTNLTQETDYWVLDTDYDSYSLVYTCQNLPNNRRAVLTWKLGRDKQLPNEANTVINNIINSNPVLDDRYYEQDDQSAQACFYYPQPDPNVPLVFPGQCDDNISVVGNFNLTQFAGVWHEIETYPKDQQTGQCINHDFTSPSTMLTLQSSSVIDQFLSVTTSNVTFASNDGSAKLNIVLNSDITIPFWILNTDYNDYALAYSCLNLNSTFRAVYSWKLSRVKQLSTPASQAISNAISAVDVLSDNYFFNVDQSDNACFYLPELAPGEPVIIVGQCNESIPVVPNFDAARYLGRWRMIETYASDFQDGTCNDAEYTLAGEVVIVYNTQVVNQTLDTITGNATFINGTNTAKLEVLFPGANESIEYWVLDTDYDTYSLVYSCRNLDSERRRVWSWKLSRTDALTANATSAINQVIDTVNVLNNRYYQTIDQSDTACFYFPEPNGQPLIFRGQCDENVTVVTNFQAANYLGLWYNIESYPSAFQTGTCNTALYTLNPTGTVEVYNTQVVNQTLDYAHAVGVLDSSGNAKLDVTFPVAGTNLTVTTNYWVLATDYNSYSLVYTCQNLENNQRAVLSWKLGREKQLTTQANTAINNAINNVQVLEQQYYEQDNQSEEGCFYYPEPDPDLPVVFPGQCDETISAVANFNLTQFAGIWNEIETYPKDEPTGECINHQFTANDAGNLLNLQSASVLDQILSIASGNVTFNSTDGSAKFDIVLNSGISIPYWILSTDYSNYALAYSCVNYNTTFRAVYSWKLSRTKQLSTAAAQAIANAISPINVLNDNYFVNVNQSDDACFYLPDLTPGEPVTFFGQCDENIPVVQNFNASRYLGRWRMIETYSSDFQDGACNDAEYSLSADVVIVYNTQVINQTLDTITGNATFASTSDVAKLEVFFPGANESINYWVLDTDYETYSLVYSCRNLNSERRRVWSWKLSRTDELTPSATSAINQVIDTVNVLNNRYYQTIDQSDTACFYFPEPNGQPLIFRGQCDENVTVVTNFQAANYLGLWYNIESYPSAFQTGTCNTALYTLNPTGTVEVYNTQVVNQTLDYAHAVGVLDSSGNAKLDVTFPVAGTNLTVTTNYWVLATDYNSYSLVYTCQNLENNQRAVLSWKLSREKQLTTQANTAINNAINNVQVLEQQYYEQDNQSEEGCFYYPEPDPDLPVVFPGQCDETISAVANFNLTQFAGIWNEIETYPKDEPTGECINHQFTANDAGNLLNLQSASVLDQILSIASGNVTFNSTDGSAKFDIVLSSGISIPYWILSTDYSNYALAYSCVNYNTTFRAVYSWKLSRTKQLSTTAAQAIANAISPINVLNDNYFVNVNQSDDACFYLPDLTPGEPVTFFGQCDENIPVVQNFNASRYLGRWRMIETYSSDFQDGACNDAEYSLSDDVVIVYNTQVINQTLDTITGNATFASTSDVAKLEVFFPGANESINYWVLDTDYETYSLVYSCRNLNSERRRVWSWKLSRTDELTPSATSAINQVIDTVNVLNNRYYQTIDQSDTACFYFPEPNGQPLIFRGQCDENVTVITNFQAANYLGLWYNIESYPSAFQTGTCNTALYTLSPTGTVEVYNTQVVNQTLDYAHAVGVLDSSGNAKLDVTFPVAGTNLTVTTNYWVLATDYNTYSLVYTCQNLENNQRAVLSWKLSRDKQLTTQANIAINNAINNVQVLEQQYYEQDNQSEEGCFYYPEPDPDLPVVFPGQCDETISAVANFNLTQFAGIWNEIETYPKDEPTGECINHQFTANDAGNLLNLQSASVLDQILSIASGNVTFNSTDGSAKFDIVLSSGISIPYWILSTDYSNYALAYSCVNYNTTFRAVYSWKLSRTKQLSTTAAQAIANAISPINVLNDNYFVNVNQSDDACFYLPDLTPGEPVTFFGQCDENIPVVQNFNAARYLGRWRMIETYSSDFQDGACNDAEYSLSDDVVIVYNTQVINQTLDTITGNATFASTSDVAKLEVFFPGANESINYWVLDTDYETYSLVYSCRNLNSERRRVWSWKLSRTDALSSYATSAINDVINTVNVLNNRYYQTIDQSDTACFYYPEPNGQPLIFRGQCDETIPVVTNFQAERYMGLWYDIESYPQFFQNGTCPTANYTLTPTEVIVYNTQVIAQRLDTITGFAVVASTDGSAKLEVTFPSVIFNISSPYWVLATDYDNYALVYSCTNLNTETRLVSSWKLSRETTLSSTAVDIIANVTSTIPVLRDEYYLVKGHTEENCFYYPDNFGGPVILDGQCDDNQTVVNNLNSALFSGNWYEASRFPSELQTGECVLNNFVISGSSITITQTTVYNEQLVTVTGTGTLDSSGQGIITATLSSGTDVRQMILYILATDYTDYALLFSCRDINASQKQVYSWKLSKNRSGLSDASNNAIDEIVTGNVDLFEDYYEETDLSDSGCFYYPVLDNPTSIILPGPCSLHNVQGKANFQLDNYLGRWFEISRYPQPSQSGQCSQAQYSLNNGIITVSNNEVSNVTLSTISGTASINSTDGSGVFIVTNVLPNGETSTARIFVLETDYTDFALVYSCLDLGTQSQVSSWKLSRNKTLSNQANAAINNVVNNTRGLNEDYYTPTSQSDDDCFYVPEPNPNQAPLFRGQCSNIPSVQNFDASRYAGWWHEIERYSSENDVGECISSRYQQSGNQYLVEEKNIVGTTARVDTGTVQISTDGRITKTLSNGSVVELWVLATDYDNYALLFSCETVDDQYIRVWSAKHSKERQLSQASEAAIAQVLPTYRYLQSDFFLQVDQSADACFYYPEPTGQPVRLPGQCDSSIPTQQNFNVVEYTGTWYQIEKYPQIHESGTCIGARYTLDSETSVVDVLNWEVVDGVLETIEGTATVASSDGSAVLSVTLPVVGSNATTTMELRVLQTDYLTYSLVYSCNNVDEYERAVGVWKLSRTRTMPNSGTTAINAYMAQREELDQRYFLQTEQNDECPDPNSSFFIKSSIIIVLVCALLQHIM